MVGQLRFYAYCALDWRQAPPGQAHLADVPGAHLLRRAVLRCGCALLHEGTSQQVFGTGTTLKPRLNLLRLEEDLSQAHLRLSQTYIEHLDWQACITKYDRALYCDPPYWGTAGYGVGFGIEQYARIAEMARTIKGKMIISVNDIPEMRKAFAGLHMESLPITYTVGGGKKGSKAAELVIWNW